MGFEELNERGDTAVIRGVTVRLACLEDIITAKERASRPKDHEALPELRHLRAIQLGVGEEKVDPDPPQPDPNLGPELG